MDSKGYPTDPADTAHNPSPSIIIKDHARGLVCGLAARIYLEMLINAKERLNARVRSTLCKVASK